MRKANQIPSYCHLPASYRSLVDLSPERRWEDNIRMDVKEIGINTKNWVDSVHDRDYWRVLVYIQPPGSINHGVC